MERPPQQLSIYIVPPSPVRSWEQKELNFFKQPAEPRIAVLVDTWLAELSGSQIEKSLDQHHHGFRAEQTTLPKSSTSTNAETLGLLPVTAQDLSEKLLSDMLDEQG